MTLWCDRGRAKRGAWHETQRKTRRQECGSGFVPSDSASEICGVHEVFPGYEEAGASGIETACERNVVYRSIRLVQECDTSVGVVLSVASYLRDRKKKGKPTFAQDTYMAAPSYQAPRHLHLRGLPRLMHTNKMINKVIYSHVTSEERS